MRCLGFQGLPLEIANKEVPIISSKKFSLEFLPKHVNSPFFFCRGEKIEDEHGFRLRAFAMSKGASCRMSEVTPQAFEYGQDVIDTENRQVRTGAIHSLAAPEQIKESSNAAC